MGVKRLTKFIAKQENKHQEEENQSLWSNYLKSSNNLTQIT